MSVDPIYNGPSGYVGMLNNPISTIDPNGEEPITIGVAIAIAAGLSAVSYTASIALSDGGFNNWDWGQFAQGVVIGAASGAVTFGIGSGFDQLAAAAVEAGKASKVAIIEIGRLATHASFQGGLSAAQGGDFWSAFASGSAGSIVGLGTSGLKGAGGHIASIGSAMLLGGFTSDAAGGDFWKGAAISGIVAGANHVAHRIGDNLQDKIAKDKAAQNSGNEITGDDITALSNQFGKFTSGQEVLDFINSFVGDNPNAFVKGSTLSKSVRNITDEARASLEGIKTISLENGKQITILNNNDGRVKIAVLPVLNLKINNGATFNFSTLTQSKAVIDISGIKVGPAGLNQVVITPTNVAVTVGIFTKNFELK